MHFFFSFGALKKVGVAGEHERLERAVASYSSILARDPMSADALDGRGLALAALGRHREAAEDFQRALGIDGHRVDLCLNLGCSLFEVGAYGRALSCHNQVLAVDSSSSKAWYNRGICLLKMGEETEGVGSLTQALRLRPDYFEAWVARGTAVARAGDVNGALQDLGRALQIEPACVDALVNRGVVHSTRGDEVSALADFRRALSLAPGHGSAKRQAAISLVRLGHFEEAVDEAGVLDLQSGAFEEDEVAPLSAYLSHPRSPARRIVLRDNCLRDTGAALIAKALAFSGSVSLLDLGDNDIGPMGAISIAGLVTANRSITVLLLGDNFFGDDGEAYLAEAMELNWSLLTLEGAGANAASFCNRNRYLRSKVVSVFSCLFRDDFVDTYTAEMMVVLGKGVRSKMLSML